MVYCNICGCGICDIARAQETVPPPQNVSVKDIDIRIGKDRNGLLSLSGIK